ncbi:phosphatidylinositol glycan anchor biosynthesis class O isoform X2 [Rhodnius prolixus]|uniref:phosphatidylinositol glycan anchor biosynthesis class O isoform X2 n=1 Tax=Rhodnius prolixus TaxID=13249 RepID=UPI003D18F4C0
MKWRYLIFIIWLSCIIVACLMIFVRGFFLSRNALEDRAVCLHNEECFVSDTKVVILLIDALRYDFVEPKDNGVEKPYTNKMVYLNQLLVEKPLNARLYKFVADPPTTTLQRIQALTTGTLPTFLDVGSNFGTPEINEDNVVDQLISKNKKVVFLGDDTWTQLYRGRFLRVAAFPSLNVWDLDTVDEGVQAGFDFELNATDWNLLMGHMLGVDHVGHRHGPLHPVMTAKLIQIDKFIKNVVERISNNTVLFVFGDHGMTESGDHGGSSELEVTSALIVFSHNKELISYFDTLEVVNQIDIVPTLSQILGVPISFSNLGRTLLTNAPNAREYLRNNLRQIYTYLLKYSHRNVLFTNEIEELAKHYEILEDKYNSKDKDYIISAIKLIEIVQHLCRSYWVQFDYLAMYSSNFLLLLTILFIFIITNCSNFILDKIIYDRDLNFGFLAVIVTELCIVILYWKRLISKFEIVSYYTTVILSLGLLLFTFMKYRKCLKRKVTISVLNLESFYAGIALLLSCLAVFSNSFVVYEQYVSAHLCNGLIWISVLSLQTSCRTSCISYLSFIRTECGRSLCATLLFSCLLRLSTIYWVCREEHDFECVVHKQGAFFSPIISAVSLTIFVLFGRILLQRYKYLEKCVKLDCMITLCVVCIICSWLMKALESWPSSKVYSKVSGLIRSTFALVALVIGSLMLAATILWPKSPTNLLWLNNLRNTEKGKMRRTVAANIRQCVSAAVNLISSLIIVLSNITGEPRAVALICCILITTLLAYNLKPLLDNKQSNLWMALVSWSLSTSCWFYGTGHQPAFPNIYWNIVELTSGYFGALLLLAETFSSHIIHALMWYSHAQSVL